MDLSQLVVGSRLNWTAKPQRLFTAWGCDPRWQEAVRARSSCSNYELFAFRHCECNRRSRWIMGWRVSFSSMRWAIAPPLMKNALRRFSPITPCVPVPTVVYVSSPDRWRPSRLSTSQLAVYFLGSRSLIVHSGPLCTRRTGSD